MAIFRSIYYYTIDNQVGGKYTFSPRHSNESLYCACTVVLVMYYLLISGGGYEAR